MREEEKYYKVKEVAEMFRVSAQSIRDWIKIGKIKAISVSERTVRIPESEVERLKNSYIGRGN